MGATTAARLLGERGVCNDEAAARMGTCHLVGIWVRLFLRRGRTLGISGQHRAAPARRRGGAGCTGPPVSGIQGDMKWSPLFLLSLAVPDIALALPIDTAFEIVLQTGAPIADRPVVATVTFRPGADTGSACRYTAGWTHAGATSVATSCQVDELKVLGHQGCPENSELAFTTVFGRAPRVDCAALDRVGSPRDVFLLAGAVLADGPTIIGLVQWTAAAPFLQSFEAKPAP